MKKKLNWTRQLTAQWNTEQLIEVSGSFQDRRLNDLKWNGFFGLDGTSVGLGAALEIQTLSTFM